MTHDVVNFNRYVGAFNNVSRIVFGTDYLNGEIGVFNGEYFSLVAVGQHFITVWLSREGGVHITLMPNPSTPDPEADAPAAVLEDTEVQDAAVMVAAEMADLLSIRELHFGSEYWTGISKNGVNLPPGWDFTNSEGGEIHLERG